MKSRLPIFVTSLLALVPVAHAGGLSGRLIAVESSRALSEINMSSGERTPIGTVSSNASTCAGLAYDPTTGTIYLTSTGNDSLFTLDLTTGAATLVGAYGDPALFMHGLEWNSGNNTLYGSSSHNTGLYTIDTTTGISTLVGVSGLANTFQNLVYVPSTDTMYATHSGTDSFYTMNLATGAMTLIGLLSGSTNPNSMAYNSVDGIIFLADNTTDILYRVNPATGQSTAVGSMGSSNILGLVYIPPVPQVVVTGTLTLQDIIPSPSFTRDITMKVEVGTLTYTSVATVSVGGSFEVYVPAASVGAATLSADGSSFLKRRVSINLTGSNVTQNLSLQNGDVDNSGEVDAADIDAVIAAFGSTGEPITDVDMSGEVDAADIDIVIANFGGTDD